MIYFQCDYAEGAHPKILTTLQDTNMIQTVGYGMDEYCAEAKQAIAHACGNPNLDIHFLVGGTQANTTIIASALRSHQGVVAVETGHIATHETGAIEATGHKVLTLPGHDGKLVSAEVEALCREHYTSDLAEHTVQPKMIYLSHPTESGTLYSKSELQAIKEICATYGLYLFMDGARLGYGLTSPANDISLPEIAALCDVFYIGGTKCGALFGEAVVINNPALSRDFRYAIKQHGGLLAKGRLLGLQFKTLFTDKLYFTICQQAITYALQIREAFQAQGIEMYGTSLTNQQFPLLTEAQIQFLQKKYVFEVWGSYDATRSIVRFCTSWATTEANMQELLADIAALPTSC